MVIESEGMVWMDGIWRLEMGYMLLLSFKFTSISS